MEVNALNPLGAGKELTLNMRVSHHGNTSTQQIVVRVACKRRRKSTFTSRRILLKFSALVGSQDKIVWDSSLYGAQSKSALNLLQLGP